MNKSHYIDYLIKQRELDWLYFNNTVSLKHKKNEQEVRKLKSDLSTWKFLTGASFTLCAMAILTIIALCLD